MKIDIYYYINSNNIIYLFHFINKNGRLLIISSNIFILLIIGSCSEQTVEPKSEILITKTNKIESYPGDTITLSGKGFGSSSGNCSIIFSDTISIASLRCIKWTESEIKFEAPYNAAGKRPYYIFSEDRQSNIIYLQVKSFPYIDTIIAPSGTYSMGSAIGFADEKPVHYVEFSNKLIVSKFEITIRQWNTVMGSDKNYNLPGNYPADSIDWLEAIEFCNKLSENQGYKKCYELNGDAVQWLDSADGWRLPTEAEWEYLCRAGTLSDYYSENPNNLGWFSDNSGFNTHPVGFKMPNSFGLYDICGNVSEWCWDFYSPDYYQNSSAFNPKGPVSGSAHIARGGSCIDGRAYIRSSCRKSNQNLIKYHGIRIVRELK